MKKLQLLWAIIALTSVFRMSAAEVSVTFADLEIANGELNTTTPIKLNDDIVLTFDKGGANVSPTLKSGKITLPMQASLSVTGTSQDIIITKIALISPKKSNTFSSVSAAVCVPEGTFEIIKEEPYSSIWSSADGANTVSIANTMGAPVFSAVIVEYSNGKDQPTDPEQPDAAKTFEFVFANLDIQGSDLVEISPLSL
ncbi:MAG: hypothetical protein K2F99_07535, partial [Muribaculaceae bacterium]|nr:hypothetical protein [Muribaculaceae bacterium]